MSNEFEREERYIVFKMPDLGNSLKGDEIRRLAREYAEHLEQFVKKPLDYVVVGAGWSEYSPALRVIEVHVTGAQPAPSIPVEAIGKMLADVMAVAVSNGANSVSMPDEYVEVAVWLQGECPTQPAPSVPDLLESLRCACNYIDKLGGVSQQYRAMLAAAQEAKP